MVGAKCSQLGWRVHALISQAVQCAADLCDTKHCHPVDGRGSIIVQRSPAHCRCTPQNQQVSSCQGAPFRLRAWPACSKSCHLVADQAGCRGQQGRVQDGPAGAGGAACGGPAAAAQHSFRSGLAAPAQSPPPAQQPTLSSSPRPGSLDTACCIVMRWPACLVLRPSKLAATALVDLVPALVIMHIPEMMQQAVLTSTV